MNCKKNLQSLHRRKLTQGKTNLVHKVVMQLTNGLDYNEHIIVVDNFLQVLLFLGLEWRGI